MMNTLTKKISENERRYKETYERTEFYLQKVKDWIIDLHIITILFLILLFPIVTLYFFSEGIIRGVLGGFFLLNLFLVIFIGFFILLYKQEAWDLELYLDLLASDSNLLKL